MTVVSCIFPDGGDAVVTLQEFNVEAYMSFWMLSLVSSGIQTGPERSLGSCAPLTVDGHLLWDSGRAGSSPT